MPRRPPPVATIAIDDHGDGEGVHWRLAIFVLDHGIVLFEQYRQETDRDWIDSECVDLPPSKIERKVTTEAFVVFHLEAADRVAAQMLEVMHGTLGNDGPAVEVTFATVVMPIESALAVLRTIDPSGYSAREVMTPLVMPGTIRVVVVAARGIGSAQLPPADGPFGQFVRGGSA